MNRYQKSRAFSALLIYGLLWRIQETVVFPLFPGAASGKLHLLMIRYQKSRFFSALLIYGLLWRIQETVVFPLFPGCGVRQITSTDDSLSKEQVFFCSFDLRPLMAYLTRSG